MIPDRDSKSEVSKADLLREIDELKKRIEWLSRQLYGRVMPGLYAMPGHEADDPADGPGDPARDGAGPEPGSGSADGLHPAELRESAAAYRVSPPASIPEEFPSEDLTIELSEREVRGMSVIGFERSEAIAMRPAVVRRRLRRTMYVASDGSGFAAAAPTPALFPDPAGGELLFDASFVAGVTDSRMSGASFASISKRLKRENDLTISAESLRRLVLFAADAIAPVCAAMVVRTLPDWMNLYRMFEESKTDGDWFADEFLRKIHALRELEEHARIRAARLGGTPEDLYRERRAARSNAARMTASFFDRCREMLPRLNAGSPLAETIRCALEHESFLSVFLYDPRVEFTRANPAMPIADPFAVLAVCADECRVRGVPFRAWLEHTLIMRKQPNPPPPESLFPR